MRACAYATYQFRGNIFGGTDRGCFREIPPLLRFKTDYWLKVEAHIKLPGRIVNLGISTLSFVCHHVCTSTTIELPEYLTHGNRY